MFINYCYRLCFTIFLQLSHNEAAKILGLFVYPSYSHQIVFQPIWRELSLKGHNVTVMSPNILNDSSLTNLTEIDISFTYEMVQKENLGENRSKNNFLFWNILSSHMFLGKLVEAEFQHEAVRKLIKDQKEHFDLVIVESLSTMIYAFGAKFDAPVISISSILPFLHCHEYMGNPTHPVYPDMMITATDNYNFMYRLKGFLYNIWYRAVFYWYTLPTMDKLVKKYFGDDMPYLGDILKNTSMILVNANPIMTIPRANVPNVVDISLMHIREKKPLPKVRINGAIPGISSILPFLHCHEYMGNPTHPVYPDMMITATDNYNFMYRLKGFLYNIWYRAVFYWYTLPTMDKLVKKYFGDDMPYLGDILKNTSMILVNANPIMTIPRANVPNVVDISLMHIREKKPLPKDLQDFLDSSTNGTIYFSLGTNVNYRNLESKFIENIIKTFSELPYNVIWKTNIENLPNKPDNVFIKKWLPQQDIFGHPNVKVFVTQGGLQSIEEAIYNGVPMVGIPFLGDQPLNINILVEKEIALRLNHEIMTKDDLKKAILEVAENKRYKQEVVKASAVLRDQPMKGVDKAIYWIEYVIRHKGARHLRSPAADMPLYQYFMVDVCLFLLAASCICIWLISKLYRLVILIRSEKLKYKKSKNN